MFVGNSQNLFGQLKAAVAPKIAGKKNPITFGKANAPIVLDTENGTGGLKIFTLQVDADS